MRIGLSNLSLIMAPRLLVLLAALVLAQGSIAQSDVSFEWVTVGDPGNPNDPLTGVWTGGETPPTRGAVPYVYSISKYETTIGQYTAFLNAVAKSDPHGLYNPDLGELDMIRGISRSRNGWKLCLLCKERFRSGGLTSANLPITFVTYPDAVRFVNWLHNGQGNGSTETGAYTISEGQITRASSSGGVLTVTTAQPHILNVGDWVSVSSAGSPQSYFDGNFVVTARTDTTFSYRSGGGDIIQNRSERGQ